MLTSTTDTLMPLVKYVGAYAEVDRGIHISVEGQFPRLYRIDVSGMHQALFNVIMNAVKYSKRSSGKNVRVFGTRELGGWIIKVQDWGIGIPEAEAECVFKKHAWCSNARAHDNTGLGLGGYIAKEIIELHGGSIEVSSFINPTEITIKLPLAR